MTGTIIRRLYHEVHTALWAILIAFLFFFPTVVLPQIKNSRAAYEAQLSAEISAENDFYCRRFGMQPGTLAYRSCRDDLRLLRASVEKRVAAEYEF
jgi:hypothetical protein